MKTLKGALKAWKFVLLTLLRIFSKIQTCWSISLMSWSHYLCINFSDSNL